MLFTTRRQQQRRESVNYTEHLSDFPPPPFPILTPCLLLRSASTKLKTNPQTFFMIISAKRFHSTRFTEHELQENQPPR